MPTIHKKSLFRHLLRAPVYLYRWHLGPLLGHRFLLLTHIGRRTGKRWQTMLEVVEYRREVTEAVVMSGFGRSSEWLLNIQANDHEEIVIGSEHFPASHRVLSESEAVQVLRDYEHRNRLIAPIVRRVLSYLAGWRYRGTNGDRERFVSQVPMLAFRPRA